MAKKSKVYQFRYPYSKAAFIENCKRLPERTGGRYLFFEKEGALEFGLERAGHSGGFWYVATPIEKDGLLLEGEIKYIGAISDEKKTKWQRVMSAVGEFLFTLLLLPLILLLFLAEGAIAICQSIKYRQRVCFTQKQKLNHLMVDILGCEKAPKK